MTWVCIFYRNQQIFVSLSIDQRSRQYIQCTRFNSKLTHALFLSHFDWKMYSSFFSHQVIFYFFWNASLDDIYMSAVQDCSLHGMTTLSCARCTGESCTLYPLRHSIKHLSPCTPLQYCLSFDDVSCIEVNRPCTNMMHSSCLYFSSKSTDFARKWCIPHFSSVPFFFVPLILHCPLLV